MRELEVGNRVLEWMQRLKLKEEVDGLRDPEWGIAKLVF